MAAAGWLGDDEATRKGKTRLIYVWGSDDKARSPKMKALIGKASSHLIRRRIENASALTAEVYASLVEHLDALGALRVPPFDAAACEGANLRDLSRKRIDWFMERAGRERGFPLKPSTTTQALLTHLNLSENGAPTNAAMLLFGSNPQRFHRTAETKCVHCHGTEYRRPFASQQIFGGDLFGQVDQARDFVLAKIGRPVGTRGVDSSAPGGYELPPEAVGEAIVNAVAHRDYHSNASVEIRLFSDRLEVWNPGTLPGLLTPASLQTDHPSIPYNPLVAESLYLARYIEKAGSGTQAMIQGCREAGLPMPQFEVRQGSIIVTLWRGWLTEAELAGFDLSDRERLGLQHAKEAGRITNAQYRELTGVSERTALRELQHLAALGLLEAAGSGRSAHFVPAKSRPTT